MALGLGYPRELCISIFVFVLHVFMAIGGGWGGVGGVSEDL